MPIPADVAARPVAVVGGGTLGRRIALMLATQGGPVRIVDPDDGVRREAERYVDAELPGLVGRLDGALAGSLTTETDLAVGVRDAWLVVEAVPEQLALKRSLFGDLEHLAPADAVLATNSSSYPSREIAATLAAETRRRVLNTHFYMPPDLAVVELMSCGETDEDVLTGLLDALPRYGLRPFRVGAESIGFIFNRIWAAVKRESLAVVAEGVSTPTDVDAIWGALVGTPTGPFHLMDRVGLDVALDIEEHYAAVREGVPEGPRRLLREYIDRGRLGVKSGRGFFEYP